MNKMIQRLVLTSFAILFTANGRVSAQARPSLRDFISAPIPTELVSARKVDRVAWLAYDKGIRNVYTALAPKFQPALVTP
jgi:hypothetical protein